MRTYLSFHAQIDQQQRAAQQFIATCTQLVQQGTTELYILLSTPGGNVMSGLTMYNMLRAISPSCKVITHNIGNIDSIGNAIFLAGEERYACPHSTFMFHGVGLQVQNITIEEKNAREVLGSILADQKRIGDIIQERTHISKSEARKLFREARTKDAQAALAAGIVHKICDVSIPQGARIVSIVC